MTDLLTFIDGLGSERDVFCTVRSVGMREFYQANGTDFHPEIKFIIADYMDYDDETLVRYGGKYYRILRTYRTGQELELIAEKAPAEDGELYG